jgi:tetratricopeptide (TPR) repeat protein
MSEIERLKDAVVKEDKIGFINAFHNFLEDDIVKLTEREFKEFQECCTKMNLDGVEEFLIFLLTEGINAWDKSKIELIKENLLISKFYLTIFLEFCPKYDINYARATIGLGNVNRELAEIGVKPKKNIADSIDLYQEVRRRYPRKTPEYRFATMDLGIDYVILADFGFEPEQNLNKSIKLHEEARKLIQKNSLEYAKITGNLGFAHLTLAQLGISPEKNLKKTITLCQNAIKKISKNNIHYSPMALNQGLAYILLAELGIKSEKNIEKGIKLQIKAREKLTEKSLDFGRTQMNEGRAYLDLAELNINKGKNLNKATKLLREAMKNLPEGCLDYAGLAIFLGITLILKSIHFGEEEIEKNIMGSIKLFGEAIDILPEESIDTGSALINQGLAHRILAEFGIEPENNLKECIKLQQKAIEILPIDQLDYARAIINQGHAYFILAEIGVEFEKNYILAENLYNISSNIFFKARDGWNYPIAILSIYELYKNIFWRSGDKSFLEKCNNSLREATKNIEEWDVLGKNIILGKLCAVEADLYEFKEDYYKAGLKYHEAFDLTINRYYRFMCEFCGIKSKSYKIEEKPFCKLVCTWKHIDKTGIFLDYYDYAVFECHLEEALENEALRFDEVNKAKSKLEDIYSRTIINHIKKRVSACIEILNAYLNYFPVKEKERDAEKATKNISTACKIFKKQGYQYEIDLCNLFVKAIENRENQKVWLDLIKNQLSNNLSKLIGEAAIREIIKTQSIGIKTDLRDIKIGITEINNNVDDLILSLKPGINEELILTVGAEFYGTGMQHVITIPLQEISYDNLKKDLEIIKDKSNLKLNLLPPKLAKKVKDYLTKNKLAEHQP